MATTASDAASTSERQPSRGAHPGPQHLRRAQRRNLCPNRGSERHARVVQPGAFATLLEMGLELPRVSRGQLSIQIGIQL
jgi:hypothetical protein